MTEPVSPPAPVTVPPYPALGSADFNTQAYAYGSAMPAVSANINATGEAAYTNAVAAKEKALAAAASESAATTQADLAMGYRNAANAAASTATTKAADAEASAVQASKLNLGAKASAPTVDNQGAALLTGAMYFDTTLGKWRAWNGAAWVDPVSVTAGVTSLNGASGALTRTTLAAYGITDGVATSGDQTIAGNKSFSGNLLVTGGALGYGVGAGGSVVQATSKATSVTLNKPSGYITTSNSALAGGATVVFRFNNSSVSADGSDVLSFTVAGYDADRYTVSASVFAPGVCSVSIKNNTAASLSEAIPINFAVIKTARS